MPEKKYIVRFDGDVIAKEMDMQDALILIEAIANKYYKNMEYGGVIELVLDKKE